MTLETIFDQLDNNLDHKITHNAMPASHMSCPHILLPQIYAKLITDKVKAGHLINHAPSKRFLFHVLPVMIDGCKMPLFLFYIKFLEQAVHE